MDTGIFSTRLLRPHGLGHSDIRRAIATGTLSRIRRGWYATEAAAPDVIAAVRIGGRLTCVDALRFHGVWMLPSSGIHVRVSSGVALGPTGGARIHWTAERVGPGVDGIAEALHAALHCADLRTLVVAVDSIAHRRLLPHHELAGILQRSPRGRRVRELLDPAAESGLETILRLALRRHRLRAKSQVVIAGVGRVDFLIGHRLVLEADGYEWHGSREAFERDRDRDRELVRRGYIVIRPSYRRILGDLDLIIDAVLAVVRRREHRWRAVHRSQLSESGYVVDLSSTKYRETES